MLKTFLVVLAAGLFATFAMAAPIAVPFATSDLSTDFTFSDAGGDTLQLIGQSGMLALDNSTATDSIFTGTYVTVSTPHTGLRMFDLMYDLTLGGVTHTISQPATWTITTGPDSFVAAAGAPVTFETAMGTWSVMADPFTIDNGAKVGTVNFTVSADIIPVTSSVPEPATLGMMGTALAGLMLIRRKWSARS